MDLGRARSLRLSSVQTVPDTIMPVGHGALQMHFAERLPTAGKPEASRPCKRVVGWGPLFPLVWSGGGGSVAEAGTSGAGAAGEGSIAWESGGEGGALAPGRPKMGSSDWSRAGLTRSACVDARS
jgi:hypothetical protein